MAGTDRPDKDEQKKPLEPHSDNPSQNSRLHAATAIQSEVKPEDYPLDQRGALGLTPPAKGKKSTRSDTVRKDGG